MDSPNRTYRLSNQPTKEGDNVTRLQAMYRASAISNRRSTASVLRTPDGFKPVRGLPADAAQVSSVFHDDHLIWSDSPGDLIQNYFGKPMTGLDEVRKELRL